MVLKDKIKVSVKNVLNRKFRTFLTSFAISVGTMLIITMVGLGIGLKDFIINEIKKQASLNAIYVTSKTSDNEKEFNLTEKEFEESQKQQTTKKLTSEALSEISKSLDSSDNMKAEINVQSSFLEIAGKRLYNNKIIGLDLRYSVICRTEEDEFRIKEKNKNAKIFAAGRNLSKEDKDDSIIIGHKLLMEMGIEKADSIIGKEILISCNSNYLQGSQKPLQIKGQLIGVLNEKYKDSDKIMVSFNTAAKIKSFYTGVTEASVYPDMVTVYLESFDGIDEIGSKIKAMGYKVETLKDIIKQIRNAFTVLQIILGIGGAIVLFVAALGVINTMLMAIYERTKSIGIMMAVGASRSDIGSMFLVESGVLGLVGGVFGILLSLMLSSILNQIIKVVLKDKGITVTEIFSISPLLMILGLGFATAVSMLSGLYPAVRASRLNPIIALKHD